MRIEIITGRNIAKKTHVATSAPSTSIEEKQSLLQDVLESMPYPVIVGFEEGDKIGIIAGQSYLEAIESFTGSKVVLKDGRSYSDLDSDDRELFTEVQIPVCVYRNPTAEMKKKVLQFCSENKAQIDSSPAIVELTQTIVHAGQGKAPITSGLIEGIKAHPFFAVTALPEITTEVVLAMMILSDSIVDTSTITDLSQKTLDAFAEAGNLVDITKQLDFLSYAFDEKETFLKKIHLPMILAGANKYMAKNSPKTYGNAVRKFYENPSVVYKKACDSGTASRSNVSKRLTELENFLSSEL